MRFIEVKTKMPIDMNDTYVKRWLMGLAKKTKHGYPSLLQDWLTFIGLSPTEQINKRMHDLTSQDITERCFFEDKWKAYVCPCFPSFLYKDKWIHDRLKVVSSFFNRNNLPLALEHGAWKSTQKQEVIEKKEKLNLDDVKRMYGHANLRDKCILLILAQSGFSEVDISELKIENIKGLYEMAVNEHYVIEKPRDKTNHVQATCLSYEFLHDLRELLAERGTPKEGYIFTSRTKGKDVTNIDVRRINDAMKTLAENTFGKDSEKTKQFETRMLRSFYNSALLRAKIQPQEIKDLMMGHEREGARANYSYDDETIREAYTSAFEFLSINGLQSREDNIKLKTEFNEKLNNQQTEYRQEIAQIKEEHKKDMEELKEIIEDLQDILDKRYPELIKYKNPEDQKKFEELKQVQQAKQP
jgi:integrase